MQMLSNLLNRDPQRQTPFIFFICQYSPIIGDAELGVFRRFDANIYSPFHGISDNRTYKKHSTKLQYHGVRCVFSRVTRKG